MIASSNVSTMFAKASGKGKLSEDRSRRPENDDTAKRKSQFMKPARVFVVQKGMGKARRDFFTRSIADYGGTSLNELTDDITHVVVDESMTFATLLGTLNVTELKQLVVFSKWLSECFKQSEIVSCDAFICPKIDDNAFKRHLPTDSAPVSNESPEKKAKTGGEHPEPSAHNAIASEDVSTSGKAGSSSRWKCSEPSSNDGRPNYNSHITAILQKMVDAYESTADKWRAFGYQKAINALKTCQKEIRTYEEALALPGIGKRLAEKIWEIIDSGELRKLEHFENDEEVKAAQLFSGIWGVGPETARIWVQQGMRTLDDVRAKAKLSSNQKVGLAHYNDFAERMPREEASRIVSTVVDAVLEFDAGFVAEGCGSYRRGKQTCGDVDVLITHPDGHSQEGLLPKLLSKLHDTGFLTSDLSVHESQLSHQKYMGVCRLPGADAKYRRLDILITHQRHFACALMHFTGSALFNRSMRSLAISKGMMLTEYTLNAGVIRKEDERLHDGKQLPTPTEESIFDYLGIPYRPPQERDW